MEELPDIAEEFMGPVLSCLDLLKNCSILFYEKEKSFWKKYCHPSLNVLSLVVYLPALTMYLRQVFRGELKLDEIAYVVSAYVVTVQAVLKATVVILKKKEIKAIIQKMGSIWRTEDLTEVQINKKNALLKRVKFCYTVVYWITMIGTTEYILAPLLETLFCKFLLQQECGLLLPFSCSFPFDPTGNWARYIGVYIFETYSNFRATYLLIGTEYLMITLCSHLVTEFTLLQEDLLNIKPGNLAPLKVVIHNHQKLISLAQDMDDVFDKLIFINLTSTSISLCFFGFSAKVSYGVLHMAKNFAAVVSLTLHLFNLCYYGEQLREASAGMADAMYKNLWYKGDISYQKLILFVITRSQKPCYLTSIKYSPITLRTFTTVMSTTWSYFSLTSSVYEGES